jgi:predicted Fe-S protein YdhL (DUF1289 family)
MTFKIDTPCIGICSTVYGDDVCRGCKRTYEEVIEWNIYKPEQKQAVYERLDAQMQAVVGEYLTVENPELLKALLEQWSIRHRDDQNPLSWALYALMFADTKISHFSEAGIIPHPPYAAYSPSDLCNLIDKHLYQHSMI